MEEYVIKVNLTNQEILIGKFANTLEMMNQYVGELKGLDDNSSDITADEVLEKVREIISTFSGDIENFAETMTVSPS